MFFIYRYLNNQSTPEYTKVNSLDNFSKLIYHQNQINNRDKYVKSLNLYVLICINIMFQKGIKLYLNGIKNGSIHLLRKTKSILLLVMIQITWFQIQSMVQYLHLNLIVWSKKFQQLKAVRRVIK